MCMVNCSILKLRLMQPGCMQAAGRALAMPLVMHMLPTWKSTWRRSVPHGTVAGPKDKLMQSPWHPPLVMAVARAQLPLLAQEATCGVLAFVTGNRRVRPSSSSNKRRRLARVHPWSSELAGSNLRTQTWIQTQSAQGHGSRDPLLLEMKLRPLLQGTVMGGLRTRLKVETIARGMLRTQVTTTGNRKQALPRQVLLELQGKRASDPGQSGEQRAAAVSLVGLVQKGVVAQQGPLLKEERAAALSLMRKGGAAPQGSSDTP